jgi:hypothetical protein
MNYTRGNMKIKGKKIEGPNTQYVVIPRGDGEDIVFKVQAILDLTAFDQLCPAPEPPKKMLPGGKMITNPEDSNYIKEINDWARKRSDFIALTSLRATEELEWETVKYDNPSTWGNYRKELKDSGFSEFEIGRLINTTMEVNCLDEDKVEQARQRFLASLGATKNGQSSHKEEVQNTQSGEPVKDLESNRQVSRM